MATSLSPPIILGCHEKAEPSRWRMKRLVIRLTFITVALDSVRKGVTRDIFLLPRSKCIHEKHKLEKARLFPLLT